MRGKRIETSVPFLAVAVTDLLGLSPEVQSFENGRLIIKLPKNQMILLAGQIWLGK
tara:strand:- start:2314 stop:2481 length:168 start_codon:yes stop_codon:yes gene_type:complete